MLNHHTAAACSPTRAMLMSGTDAHLGGLGCLIEYKNSPQGAQRWGGKAGYEGYLNQDVAALPEILGDNGYFTVISGKVMIIRCLSLSFLLYSHRKLVAFRATRKSGAFRAWVSKSICHASWLLQPLCLGARSGALRTGRFPSAHREWA
jgi:Sulfatase